MATRRFEIRPLNGSFPPYREGGGLPSTAETVTLEERAPRCPGGWHPAALLVTMTVLLKQATGIFLGGIHVRPCRTLRRHFDRQREEG